MAFKSLKTYNEEKYGGWFRLTDDRENADVIFLYRSESDAMIADMHYIKSAEYSGYVHCCGEGCPACAKNIRVQTRLFVPVYNLKTGEIQIFDRPRQFDKQLYQDVFKNFPNPSEYVFKIVRDGVANDINTHYKIQAVGKNNFKSYDQICEEFHTSFPEYYSNKCREYSISELADLLTPTAYSGSSEVQLPDYQITPRAIPEVSAPTVPFEAPVTVPVVAPEVPVVVPEVPVAAQTVLLDNPAAPVVSAEETVPFNADPEPPHQLTLGEIAETEELDEEDVHF